jgi:hypothetical protein
MDENPLRNTNKDEWYAGDGGNTSVVSGAGRHSVHISSEEDTDKEDSF